jgi:hypothetical protein
MAPRPAGKSQLNSLVDLLEWSEACTPMSYIVNGGQYIVIAIADQAYPAELVAFKLPN